jgi:hypothetical protein
MKTIIFVISLLVQLTKSNYQINASRDLKTLSVKLINPALKDAIKEALKKTYKPNPNPFNNSHVIQRLK